MNEQTNFQRSTTVSNINITTTPTIQVLVSINPGVTTLISCAIIALLVILYITYVSTIGSDSSEDDSKVSNISSLQNERILQDSEPLSAFSPYYASCKNDLMSHHQIDEYVTFASRSDNMILSFNCEDSTDHNYHRCYGDENERIEDV